MKAFILAAGLGTRLKPLTNTIPKALVRVNNIPLIEHVIRKLIKAGVTEIMINLHYFPEQIKEFISTKQSFGITIEFSEEKELLDTGGGVKKIADFIDNNQPFFMYNTDILSNVNLQEMYNIHCTTNALSTLFVSKRPSGRHLLFDNNQFLKAWRNNHTGEVKPVEEIYHYQHYNPFAFNGIHVISPRIFELMKKWPDTFSIIDFYLAIAKFHPVKSYSAEAVKIMDIGKIETLQQAESFLKQLES